MSKHSVESGIKALREYISEQGLKHSRQRELITEVFLECDEHIRVEDLLIRVRGFDERVSQATIYRTMKLLVDCGIAEARFFNDGHTRYEAATGTGEHHDHILCVACGKIVEFVDDRIERLQVEVAARYGFRVTSHKMELYGICDDEECSDTKPK